MDIRCFPEVFAEYVVDFMFMASSKGLLTSQVLHIGDLFQSQRTAKGHPGFPSSRFVSLQG